MNNPRSLGGMLFMALYVIEGGMIIFNILMVKNFEHFWIWVILGWWLALVIISFALTKSNWKYKEDGLRLTLVVATTIFAQLATVVTKNATCIVALYLMEWLCATLYFHAKDGIRVVTLQLLLYAITVYFCGSRIPDMNYLFNLDAVVTLLLAYWMSHQINVLVDHMHIHNEEQRQSAEDLVKVVEAKCAEARVATKAKSDFLASMSHEIRTPINAVIGMNEMILRKNHDAQTRKYAYDIRNAANTLLSLINDILDSSKIESGKMEIIPVEYEIRSLLNDLYNMIEVKARQKDLELKFEIDPNLCSWYFGDDVRIRQIVINILTNAVKYTEEGQVTFRLSMDREDQNAILHFAVQDTGIGIKKEDLPKLFDRYQRIEEKRNRNIEGTGLGMGIVTRLLSLMNSKLEIDSVYGEGSTFYFDLVQPIINEEAIGEFSNHIMVSEEDEEFVQTYTAPEANILVVDDNNINRQVFLNFLSEAHMHIDEASSGQEAINMMGHYSYDIVFLDHMMPGMDGMETFHILESKNLIKGTPMIMLSANAVAGAKEMYLRAGFTDYLSKPIRPEKLDEAILNYLPKHKIHYENAKAAEAPSPAPTRREEIKDAEAKKKADALRAALYGEPKEEEKPASKLEYLEGFEWSVALQIFPTEDMLLDTLPDFVSFAEEEGPNLETKLQTLLANSAEGSEERASAMKEYRVLAHSIKSTSATMGAMALSKLAKLSEYAAADDNLELVKALHPVVLQELTDHGHRLSSFLEQQG